MQYIRIAEKIVVVNLCMRGNRMLVYQLYGGFSVQSDFSLNEKSDLVEYQDSNPFPTVTVKVSFLENSLKEKEPIMNSREFCLKISNGEDWMYIFQQRIEFYSHSLCIPSSKAILKCGIGLLSFLYNRTVLHGNVFLLHDKAYAIVAPSGLGKSTFTAAMIQYCNAVLLSEDSVYLDEDGSTTYSGLRELYLFSDSANAIFGHNNYKMEEGKCVWSDEVSINKGAFSLGGILIISDNIDQAIINIHKVQPKDAFISFMNNIRFRREINSAMVLNSMRILSKMSSQIPVYEISLNKKYEYLPIQATEVEQVLKRQYEK